MKDYYYFSYLLKDIMAVVDNCEEIQKSEVSANTKDREKVYAYDDIADICAYIKKQMKPAPEDMFFEHYRKLREHYDGKESE